jgi:hypothetical protein
VATGQRKFLVVSIDYFTKWIEASPLTAITVDNVQKFIWKNIVCRHGIPHTLISGNSTQFTSSKIVEFCQELGIQQIFSSVELPQTNEQAEVANKIILKGLRQRLKSAKGKWVDELPIVLWSYHITEQTSTKLTYGHDAMIPIEIREPTIRVKTFDEAGNEEKMKLDLEMLEEIRKESRVRQEAAKRQAARRFNKKVIPRTFQQGDLVLRRADRPRRRAQDGKVATNWDDPYRIRENVGKGAYRLEELDDCHLPNTWNATHLRCFFY